MRYAAALRHTDEPPRCVLCGFVISEDGEQLQPLEQRKAPEP